MTPFSSTNQIEKDQRKKKQPVALLFLNFLSFQTEGNGTQIEQHTRRHITVSLLFLNFLSFQTEENQKERKRRQER